MGWIRVEEVVREQLKLRCRQCFLDRVKDAEDAILVEEKENESK